MLDHGQPDDAEGLFNEAVEIKKDCAGAYLGLALVADGEFGANATELAQKALKIDPKLVEAQELLARLALEDNDDRKAAEGSHKGAGPRCQFRSGQGRAGHHGLAGGQEGEPLGSA